MIIKHGNYQISFVKFMQENNKKLDIVVCILIQLYGG